MCEAHPQRKSYTPYNVGVSTHRKNITAPYIVGMIEKICNVHCGYKHTERKYYAMYIVGGNIHREDVMQCTSWM